MEQESFEQQIIQLNRQITAHFLYFMNKRSEALNLPVLQIQILLTLAKRESTVKALSEQFFIAKSNMSTLLKSMEKRALLTRTRCKEDERKTVIKLDVKGAQIVEEYMTASKQQSFEHIKATKEEQETIISGLTTLLNLLEKVRNY